MANRRTAGSSFLLVLLLAGSLGAQSAVPAPLITRQAAVIGAEAWDLHVGASWAASTVPAPLLDTSREGDLLQAPLFRFRYGLGRRGQVELEWPVWMSFDPDRSPLGSNEETGDLRLWSQVELGNPDGVGRTSIALGFGLKVPSSSEEEGLATDEADLYGTFLLDREIGQTLMLLNLGLGVLGDPLRNGEQVDVLVYGLAFEVPVRGSVLMFEVAGWDDTLADRDPGGVSEARLGWRVPAGPGTFTGALLAGLTSNSPDWGASLGYTWSSER